MKICFWCKKYTPDQLAAGPMFADFCNDRHRNLYAEWKFRCAYGSNQPATPIFRHIPGPERNIAPAPPINDFNPRGFPGYRQTEINAGHPVCQRKKED